LADKAPPSAERYNRVVFLGRQVKSKGITDLIEAMRFVWDVIPDADLLLAGIRVPETVEIDEQIAALPAAWRKQVRNFGAVSEVQKDKLLRSSRCLVLPSKTESFGIVIVEAWTRATPVVAWDLPVFRSIIEDGCTGVLVDPSGGPQALGRAILRILRDTKAAKQMGEAGQRHAANAYSWKSMAAVYLKAYEYAVEHARAM
jgi:glycosyltransferase involved in cell wall biosynthesis